MSSLLAFPITEECQHSIPNGHIYFSPDCKTGETKVTVTLHMHCAGCLGCLWDELDKPEYFGYCIHCYLANRPNLESSLEHKHPGDQFGKTTFVYEYLVVLIPGDVEKFCQISSRDDASNIVLQIPHAKKIQQYNTCSRVKFTSNNELQYI